MTLLCISNGLNSKWPNVLSCPNYLHYICRNTVSIVLLFCRFAQEDSGETILFDDPEGEKSITGPGPLIKAGTIHKLVERLTYHEYAGESGIIYSRKFQGGPIFMVFVAN